LGVILFVMVKGHPPFNPDRANPAQAVHAFARALEADATTVTQYLEDVSPTVRELILSLLTVDPLARISVDAARRHAWLNDEEEVQAAGGKKMRSVSVVEP
jgi:serine/threonine protein kinase